MLERLRAHLESRRGWRGPATAAGLGALGALALPPVHALPVLWLSLPGLLLLVGAPGTTARRAALLGLAWGWGHHAAGLYWITEAVLVEAERFWWLVPLAVPALALPVGAYAALPALAAWAARPGWPRVVAFAAAWALAEALRGWLLTGFPWNLLGTAWAFGAAPLQAAAWVGVYGLSLATALLALAPLLGRRGWAGAAAGLAALGLFGAARLLAEEPPPQPVALVLVQGNVAQEAKWREESRGPIFRRYLAITREAAAEAAREARPGDRIAVVWPETASPFLLAQDPDAMRLAGEALPEGAVLLAGTVRAEFAPPGEGGRARRVWNSLAALDPRGGLLALYDKARLVPFGEYMPLSGLLPVRLAAGGMDFSAGPGDRAVEVPGLPAFSALICYEVIFPGAVARPTASGERPTWLLNVTNDAWFGRSAGPHQHLAAARLRAVEEGLPVARAAQTGISAVFDARGREVARLGLGETGVVTAPLPGALGGTTPFARAGVWPILVLSLLLFCVAWLYGRRGLNPAPN